MIGKLGFIEDFVALFYPRLCLACSQNTPPKNDFICLLCQYKLPKTNYHLEKENKFTERFWGRLELQTGAALYHFSKGGRTQQLIHNLKYQNKRELGVKLGELYGELLAQTPWFQSVDLIVPVPLHPKKLHKRGYNQSDQFAMGLSTSLQKPWSGKVLLRKSYTESQTHKSRFERLQNVFNAFALSKANLITGKHILLVDDVLTTGATLEACGLQILSAPNTRLSMATIAIAKH